MNPQKLKQVRRLRRRRHVRRKIVGTVERPRLTVFRSSKHIYAQLIDDLNGRTLAAASSNAPDLHKDVGYGGNVKAAKVVGKRLAEVAKERGITKAAFDRGHYRYHGRIKALADAARQEQDEQIMARDRGEGRQDGLEDRVVKIRRCAAVVKGGRRFSFNALVVVGDNKGRVASGYGKANEVPPAVEKATKDAQETLKRSKRVSMRGDTIPHRVIGKFGGSRVILVPAGPGTGVKAGPGVRDVLEVCGVRNILTKVHGSSNPINLVKATIAGLQMLRTKEDVARLRGVTL